MSTLQRNGIKSQGNGKRKPNKPIRRDECDKIVAIIEKYGLNKTNLATVIDVSKGDFSAKMLELRYAKFTQPQKLALQKYLLGMAKEINVMK